MGHREGNFTDVAVLVLAVFFKSLRHQMQISDSVRLWNIMALLTLDFVGTAVIFG